MSDPLRSAVIKLAHANPELRVHLLPILTASTEHEAGSYQDYTERKKRENKPALSKEDWETRFGDKAKGENKDKKTHQRLRSEHQDQGDAARDAGEHEAADAHGHAAKAHAAAGANPANKALSSAAYAAGHHALALNIKAQTRHEGKDPKVDAAIKAHERASKSHDGGHTDAEKHSVDAHNATDKAMHGLTQFRP